MCILQWLVPFFSLSPFISTRSPCTTFQPSDSRTHKTMATISKYKNLKTKKKKGSGHSIKWQRKTYTTENRKCANEMRMCAWLCKDREIEVHFPEYCHCKSIYMQKCFYVLMSSLDSFHFLFRFGVLLQCCTT